ncbi:MAG: glutamine amidotransferase [Chitinispirillales bacterium]|jgi:putative intracellular protease/amidase|nr:glutamine amidotransferase [Chitinispirillales bacterium]
MNVYLYLLDTLADWEIGFLTAELNSERYFDKDKGPISIIKIGNTMASIKTMGGIAINPDKCIDDVVFMDNDILILPGGDTWINNEVNNKIIKIVSEIINKKIIVAAICGATIALANNGLLNNRRHTSNSKEFLEMVCPKYTGSKYYLNEPAAVDDNLITATGLAPIEFTYEVLKKTNLIKENVLEAWFQLYKTREAKYYYSLMEAMK